MQWSAEYEVSQLGIKPLDETGIIVDHTIPPPEKCCLKLWSREAVPKGQILHLILEAEDNGPPTLVSYRRIIIQTIIEKLLGGGGGAEAIGDLMRDIIQSS